MHLGKLQASQTACVNVLQLANEG